MNLGISHTKENKLNFKTYLSEKKLELNLKARGVRTPDNFKAFTDKLAKYKMDWMVPREGFISFYDKKDYEIAKEILG